MTIATWTWWTASASRCLTTWWTIREVWWRVSTKWWSSWWTYYIAPSQRNEKMMSHYGNQQFEVANPMALWVNYLSSCDDNQDMSFPSSSRWFVQLRSDCIVAAPKIAQQWPWSLFVVAEATISRWWLLKSIVIHCVYGNSLLEQMNRIINANT